MTPKEMALLLAQALDSKKGKDIRVLETDSVTTLADYFVLCTGTSAPQLQALADAGERAMKEAGILPSFYGLHVWNWGDRHRDIFLGPDRAARLDPAGSAVREGLPFSLHADTPVLPQMTMLSIHTAVNRETKGGAVLGPDQRISTLEAVRAYTSYAALFSHSEAWRGTIEPGKVADFVIPSEDILEAPAGRLKGIAFAAAIVDNRVVHGQLP